MAVYRLQKVWPEYRDRVRIVFRALSLELKNHQSTPKHIVDQENLVIARQEPELRIWPWRKADFAYVPTLLPAFEACKAAAQQGEEAGWAFEWQVRFAFFAQSRTICMRFVLADIAREAGLDVDRFLRDWDSGRFRQEVIAENHRGWEVLKVLCSPTFVLSDGEQISNPGAVGVEWGRNQEIVGIIPANCPDGDCLQVYRALLDKAAAGR